MARKVEKVDKDKIKVTEDVSRVYNVEDMRTHKVELERQRAEIQRTSAIEIGYIDTEIARIDEILAEVDKLK